MKIAAAYIRVSTEEQIEYSPDSQLEKIREYAKRNAYILPKEFVFIDEGISGKKAKKRPSFMHMIGLAKTKPKPFDAILLWKFSRFARNREDSIVYKSMLRKQLGIDVISVSENIGDDKMSILIEAMIEAMDEFYSINLAEEVKRGMTEKIKRGEYCSIAPFGYKLVNKLLIPHEEEAPIIQMVFKKFAEGYSMLFLAKELNALGIRTHRGGKIENRTIDYWLNNPVYVGKVRWCPSGALNRHFNSSEALVADGIHTPIVSKELWNNVQERIKENKSHFSKYYRAPVNKISHWLIGLLRCGVCGRAMSNYNGYFCCGGRAKGICSGNGSISKKIAEEIVFKSFDDIINGINTENIIIERPIISQTVSETEMYSSRLKKLNAKLERIKEAYSSGIDSLEEYKENKQKLTLEINEATNKLNSLANISFSREKYLKESSKRILDSIGTVKDASLDNITRNQAARHFIKEIIKSGQTGETLSIIYRL